MPTRSTATRTHLKCHDNDDHLREAFVYESRTIGDLFREEVYGICLLEENLSGYKRFLFTVRTEPHKKKSISYETLTITSILLSKLKTIRIEPP